jgi:hypothetical protein
MDRSIRTVAARNGSDWQTGDSEFTNNDVPNTQARRDPPLEKLALGSLLLLLAAGIFRSHLFCRMLFQSPCWRMHCAYCCGKPGERAQTRSYGFCTRLTPGSLFTCFCARRPRRVSLQNPLPSTADRDNFSDQSWATEFFAQ